MVLTAKCGRSTCQALLDLFVYALTSKDFGRHHSARRLFVWMLGRVLHNWAAGVDDPTVIRHSQRTMAVAAGIGAPEDWSALVKAEKKLRSLGLIERTPGTKGDWLTAAAAKAGSDSVPGRTDSADEYGSVRVSNLSQLPISAYRCRCTERLLRQATHQVFEWTALGSSCLRAWMALDEAVPYTVATVAARSGLPRSTVHRLLKDHLAEVGMASKVGTSWVGRYPPLRQVQEQHFPHLADLGERRRTRAALATEAHRLRCAALRAGKSPDERPRPTATVAHLDPSPTEQYVEHYTDDQVAL